MPKSTPEAFLRLCSTVRSTLDPKMLAIQHVFLADMFGFLQSNQKSLANGDARFGALRYTHTHGGANKQRTKELHTRAHTHKAKTFTKNSDCQSRVRTMYHSRTSAKRKTGEISTFHPRISSRQMPRKSWQKLPGTFPLPLLILARTLKANRNTAKFINNKIFKQQIL